MQSWRGNQLTYRGSQVGNTSDPGQQPSKQEHAEQGISSTEIK